MCFLSFFVQGSDTTVVENEFKIPKQIDVDLIYSYYEQDGDLSPVTGGKGTQALTDAVSQLKVNIPFKNGNAIAVSITQDQYSSASTDNIDATISSASVIDARTYGNINYSKSSTNEREVFGIGVGYSTEWDVESLSANANWSLTTKDRLKGYSLNFSLFRDDWELIYPFELRPIALLNNQEFVDDNVRYSLSSGFTFERVINKKLITSITGELIYQKGLLSTPFHRVFFIDIEQHTVEYLPSQRIRYPITVKTNYYLIDNLILKAYFRSYYDSFDVIGQTYKLELATKISRALTLYPFGRYHHQSNSKYYAPFAEHLSSSTYYTSDSDLAKFDAYQFGLGLSLNPIYGIFKMKIPKTKRNQSLIIQSIDVRYAHYFQTTGLTADIISLAVKFKL